MKSGNEILTDPPDAEAEKPRRCGVRKFQAIPLQGNNFLRRLYYYKWDISIQPELLMNMICLSRALKLNDFMLTHENNSGQSG